MNKIHGDRPSYFTLYNCRYPEPSRIDLNATGIPFDLVYCPLLFSSLFYTEKILNVVLFIEKIIGKTVTDTRTAEK